MALLKAFVCQVVLFGLYKMFLEQVVEDHLVPDELTRNCLVGFVILLCFGIQLYTDKAEDEIAEIEEDPKTKSKSRESTSAKKSESPEISVTSETVTKTVRSDAPSQVMNAKIQTAQQEVYTAEKQNLKTQQVVDLQEGNCTLPSTEAEEVHKKSHPGIFAKFSTNVPDKIDSAVKTTYESETKTSPVLNGLSEINVSQESEEEGIEIDQFVCKESSKAAEQLITVDEEVCSTQPELAKEAVVESDKLTSKALKISFTKDLGSEPTIDESQQLITVKSEEVQTIKPENVTETEVDSENLMSNGVKNSTIQNLNPDPMIVESHQLMKVKVETINKENLTEAVESEYLTSNGVNISSKPDLGSNPTIDESESQFINDAVMESSNITGEIPSNITNGSKMNSKEDGYEIGDGREITSTYVSEPDIRLKDIKESLLSTQDIKSPSTVSTKTVNKGQTVNKNNVETSTAVNTTIPSTRRKISASEGVCVTYFPVDISFIYACH